LVPYPERVLARRDNEDLKGLLEDPKDPVRSEASLKDPRSLKDF
jgi:hypothetical protein